MDLSAGSLFASLAVSTVGLAIFTYGRKQQRAPHFAAGVVLMIFPYAVPNALAMLAIAAAILFATWLAARNGW